jgi:2-keto-4-pentenoate hydratase/2-oxohepta-3-ene-1,7-dioic acid hydratase in catechol pathway
MSNDEILGSPPAVTLAELLRRDGGLERAAEEVERAPHERVPVDGADLAAPLVPHQIRDCLCFLDHLRNARGTSDLEPIWDEIPGFYFSNVAAVVGPYDPVRVSPGCEMFDFELEIGAVIGREVSDADPADAADAIVGFMILCDWSSRDIQLNEMNLGLGPAKGKDGANTLGPALVTVDELKPHRAGRSFDLEMRAFVNGNLVGGGNMTQMDWSWGQIVAYTSRGTRLVPGDVLGSGTVPTGCLLEHFRTAPADEFRGWLEPGDIVRLEVDQLGHTEQRVVEPVALRSLGAPAS